MNKNKRLNKFWRYNKQIGTTADGRAINRGNIEDLKYELKGAKLRDADLSGLDLSGADLRDADLSTANMYSTELAEADLRRSNMSFCILEFSKLGGADARGAILRESDLSWSSCINTKFDRADFTGANLEYADLREASLRSIVCDENILEAELDSSSREYFFEIYGKDEEDEEE